ncbi:MAG: hypothetical protein MJK15_10265 [Colwellia sp.]|nr:hypothetical protein [Colwellia sp.]
MFIGKVIQVRCFMFRILVGFSFLINLVACQESSDVLCVGAKPVTFSEDSIFINVSQSLSVIPSSGNILALACHNCYKNNDEQLDASLNKISAGIDNNADLIELDLVLDNKGMFRVSHEFESAGVAFSDIIAQSLLLDSELLLFIEFKQELKELQSIRSFLHSLLIHTNVSGQYAYLNNNRFIIVRNIQNNKTLSRFRIVLAEDEFADIEDFVKLSRLHDNKSEIKIFTEITKAHQCGFHMVEFDLRLGINAILRLNAYAESLGLAVNVFTLVDNRDLNLVVSALKHDVDVLTIEDNRSKQETENSLIQYVKQLLSYI